jgi:hypothetical protein
MPKIFTLTLFALISYATLVAQQSQNSKDWYLKVSGGSVSFGTGVFANTYGIGIDVSKNIIKKPKLGIGKLLVGGELLFEQGVNSPKMGRLSEEEGSPFFSFYHVSSSTLWPKVSYHPFRKGFSGFALQVGPTIGYTFYSAEESSSLISSPGGGYFRQSAISYDHGIRVGYRLSTAYEFTICKTWLAGLRVDFSNTQKGEINTLLGIKGGVRF